MARYDLEYGRDRYDANYQRPRRGRARPEERTAFRGRDRFEFREEHPRFRRERAPYGQEYGGGRARGQGYGREHRGFGREYGGFGGEYGGYGGEYRGYGEEAGGYGLGRVPEDRTWGYGREYGKSRWETDYGDPFRDRERGTPIRMIRGSWDEYAGEYFGRERGRRGGRGEGYDYGFEYGPRRSRRY